MSSQFSGLFKVGETVYVNHPTESWIVGKVEAADKNNKKGAYTIKPVASLNDSLANEVSWNHHYLIVVILYVH